MTGDVVRWGFIGAGFIASQALAPATHAAEHATLQAAAAREEARARRLGPGRVHTTYRAVLDDDDVDAVYISLSNEAHLPWIVESLRAGKHVLCEKPLTLNATECAAAHAAATSSGRLLVEATWTRWHPRYRRAGDLLADGAAGSVRSVQGAFTFDGVPDGNYRLQADRGGGALLDVGPYLLWPLVDWCSHEWTSVEAASRQHRDGVDLTTDVFLGAPGCTARLHASIHEPEHQELQISAESLTLTWGSPAHTSWHAESSLTLDDGTRVWTERFAPCDAYRLMVEDVSLAVLGETAGGLPTRNQSLATAELIDAIAGAQRPAQRADPAGT